MTRFPSSLAFLWCVAVASAAPAWSADAGAKPPGGAREPSQPSAGADAVTLNFVNADIEGVVKAVSKITGKNFLVDPRVKGTINIVSGRPISRALVYDTFLSALRLQGFVAVEDRGLVKIVPEADARLQALPTVGAQDKPRARGDEMQTRVFALKYESATQLVPILRPLISANNTIAAYQNNNTLVITDYASNIQRIERIIESIDQPAGTDPILIPLRHASALDVAQAVARLFAEPAQGAGAAGDASQRVVIVPDTRSNSLMARSDNPSRLARLRSLVAMLDSPTSSAGNIHVVHLKNAEAVRVAETLRAIYQGDAAPAASRSAPAVTAYATSMSGPPSGASPSLSPLISSVPTTSQTGAPLGSGIIQADPATNSIIITAPDAIYQNLRAALDKLDTRRAQVYIEALIAEISAEKAAEFGIQWQQISSGGNIDGSSRAFGGTNFGGPGQNIIGIAQDPGTAGRGLNIGVVKGRVTIPGVGEILNLGLLVRALETDNNANILSTPTLLTLDNEEARIIIGQNVPFITGQYALSGSATTPSPFQTIERRDVGLTLRVKPQISEGGTVRMQIFQEVSSVVDNTNPAGVITNKRAVESTVLVDDGQIVVIGGLIQDQMKDGVEKVPVLGDIPLFGALFQYKTRSRSKTNLMVFLRPTVLRDAQRADSITGDRYDYILGEQRKLQPAPSPGLPDVDSPQLPSKKP
jgi:general secretion pathway protein D